MAETASQYQAVLNNLEVGGVRKLESQFNLKVKSLACESGEEAYSLHILNYKQHNIKQKYDPVTRLCRGLVVREHTRSEEAKGQPKYEVVGCSFERFYNLGEGADEVADSQVIQDAFADSAAELCISEKLDGSLMTLFHDGTTWRVTTRGSFATGNLMSRQPGTRATVTWRAKFEELLGFALDDGSLDAAVPQTYSLVFEMCARGNEVVTVYEEEMLTLLAVRDKARGCAELGPNAVDAVAEAAGWNRPANGVFSQKTLEESLAEVYEGKKDDFEGYVLSLFNASEGRFTRVKCKQPSYLLLHRSNWTVLQMIAKGEMDEMLTLPSLRKSQLGQQIRELQQHFETVLTDIQAAVDEIREATKHLDPRSNECRGTMAKLVQAKSASVPHVKTANAVLGGRVKSWAAFRHKVLAPAIAKSMKGQPVLVAA